MRVELARSADLEVVKAVEHAGLWLDRCYEGEAAEGEKSRREALHRRAIEALRMDGPAVAAWRAGYARWQRDALAEGAARRVLVVETTARLLLHPNSNASVTDGSVLLHHTWGVPYLPGSALKGITRAQLRGRVTETVEKALFGRVKEKEGDFSEAAVLDFHDAMWIPEAPLGANASWSPLVRDVVNPHHSAYYTGGKPPGDNEEPVPTHRLTVAKGARFVVVVEAVVPGAEARPWLDLVVDEGLVGALEQRGLGAWTRAGYGRFAVREGRSTTEAKAGAAAEWFTVVVYLDPGSGRLSCALPDGRRAEVSGAQAKALREGLGAATQATLTKKKAARAVVRVEAFGNAWIIRAVKDA